MSDVEQRVKQQPRSLGRGLANLLSSTVSVQGETGLRVKQIPLDVLQTHPRQPRTKFETQALEELAHSIREHGVLQPIIVSEVKDAGMYKIIAGERRYRAAKMVGLKYIPALVREPLDMSESFELALIENIQRENLSPLEEARAYQILIDEYHISQEELAKRVGKDRSSVTNALRLIKLHPEIITALELNKISVGHAKILCGIAFESQPNFLKVILKKNLSVRGLEEHIQPREEQPVSKNKEQNQNLTKIDPQYQRMCKAAEELLSMKVLLVPTDEQKGQVIFHYHSLEALKELFDVLVVK